jgi:hypothetical protein
MFYGAYVLAGAPRDIVERLGHEFRAALGKASMPQKFAAITVEPETRWIFRWSRAASEGSQSGPMCETIVAELR